MKQPVFHVRVVLLGLLLALSIMATPVAADDIPEEEQAQAGDLLENLHQFRVQNFLALNAYYNFSESPDNQRYEDINSSIRLATSLLDQISDTSGDSLSGEELDELREAFANFEEQMDTNVEDIRTAGYPDLRLLSEMAEQAQSLSLLSESLYDSVADQDRTPTQDKIEKAREASVMMALMVTRYSARTTSSVAQIFQGAETDKDLDEMAERFDELLEQLKRDSTDDVVDGLLTDVSSKWGFIHSSYVQYDERDVSFVINRYSLNIVDNLEKVIERLSSL